MELVLIEKNSLASENEVLKKENDLLRYTIDEYKGREEIDKEIINDLHTEFENIKKENEQLKQQVKDCTAKAKEEIRKEKEEMAIRWANIGR